MAYLNILRSLADQQQFSELKANAQALWSENGQLAALPLLALALAKLGEYTKASQVCEQAAAHMAALDLDAQVDLAGVYCVLLRWQMAVPMLEVVLEQQPEHALALARLAWCRICEGREAEARQLYLRSATLDPHRFTVWCALARLCLQEGDLLAAQQAHDAARIDAGELRSEIAAEFTGQLQALQLEIQVASGEIAKAEQWLEAHVASLNEATWVRLVRGFTLQLAGQDQHAAADDFLRAALKYYPENSDLISQMAERAQCQGQIPQSIYLLRLGIALARKQGQPEISWWVRLSGACLHQMDQLARQAAETALEQAEALQEDEYTSAEMIQVLRWQAKNALAQVESQDQHFALAETLFREILAENPWFLPAIQGLGQQQMQCGQIEEAITLFERIKEIDPAKGYSALINARRFPEDKETLDRLEWMARQPGLGGRSQPGLLLQLASAWEKQKDYEKAFALAAEANLGSKKFLSYDAKVHRQSCAQIRYAFCKELYEHRKGCGVASSLPVFVLGMPRSGTTLIEQILASHSQICGAGELGIIPARIQGLNRWERHTGSGRSYPDCIDDLNAATAEGIANGILEELQAFDPDARHVVDKLPHNFENIGLIKFLFPNARIISVRRDPRDIAISNYFMDFQAKFGGMGFAYDLTWIGEQLADHNLLMQHWHQLFPGEILEMNYEDVVEDTEGMARKMLAYIGVDWEPQVLNFSELDRPVKTASVWQVRQPIYKTSKAKWMHYEKHLAPLIQGTNGKITWDAIEMVTLPEAGLLTDGVALYKQQQFAEAELCFKKLLHHIPNHAAANYMLGLICVQSDDIHAGIQLMEKAVQHCPWKADWREDLANAFELAGLPEKAAGLRQAREPQADHPADVDLNMDLSSLRISGEQA